MVTAMSLLMDSSESAGLETGIVAQVKSPCTAVHQSVELMQTLYCRNPASHNVQVTELGLELDLHMERRRTVCCIAAGQTFINTMLNDSRSYILPLAGLRAYEGAEAHHVHEQTNRYYLFRIYLQATPTAYAKLSVAGKVYSSVNWTTFCVLDKASIGT